MPSSRPNIIVITTDQQRTDTLSCYGSAFTSTPAIDGLAAQGVLFERAYCANPVCNPSRPSIFTGRYPSRHGVWNVDINLPDDEVLISHTLAAAGYRTHYVGKTHFQFWEGKFDETIESIPDWEKRFPAFTGPYYGFQTVELSLGHAHWGLRGHYGAWVRDHCTPEQFDAWRKASPVVGEKFEGCACYWDIPLKFHQSVWAADRAIDFLQKRDPSQPFMLAIGFHDPHHAHSLPREFIHRVDPAAVPLPDYTPGELDDKPEFFREASEGTCEQSNWRGKYAIAGQAGGGAFTAMSEEQHRLARAYYYGMVKLLDGQMARIVAELTRLGLDNDTMVIFTTDHGELLGDHGIYLKGPFLYEQLVRVPMIVRYPTTMPAGRRIDSLVSHVDIVPTILATTGQAAAKPLDGNDLAPLASGEVGRLHEAVLIEHTDDPYKIRMKTIVTPTRKLTRYQGQEFGELFDLEKDPREKVNRWNDPAYAADKAALLGKMMDMLEVLDRREERKYYV